MTSRLMLAYVAALLMLADSCSVTAQELQETKLAVQADEPSATASQPLVVISDDPHLKPVLDSLIKSGQYKVLVNDSAWHPAQLFASWGDPEVSLSLRLLKSELDNAQETIERLVAAGVYRCEISLSSNKTNEGTLTAKRETPASIVSRILEEAKQLKNFRIATVVNEPNPAGIQSTGLGIPVSAIPGKRWVESGKLIVAIGDNLTQAFAYCDRFPKWTSVDLPVKVEERLPIMVVGNDVAAVWLGKFCLSYSSFNGNWDILTVAENESAMPAVQSVGTGNAESLVVHSPSRGDFVFKNEWGKWFSADEIKQGKVAEFLSQQNRQATTEEPNHGEPLVWPLKHLKPETAERTLVDVFGNRGKLFAKAVPQNNQLIIRADKETLESAIRLLEDLENTSADEDKQQSVRKYSAAGDPELTYNVLSNMLAGLPGLKLSLDPSDKTLVLLGRAADHQLAENVLKALVPRSSEFQVIQLNKLDTQLALATVRKFFDLDNNKDPNNPIVDGNLLAKQLWVKGTANQVIQIRELIAKLEGGSTDNSALNDVNASTSNAPFASIRTSESKMNELQKKYELLDQKARGIAAELRAKPNEDAIGHRRLRDSLNQAVSEAFTARQQLHQAELEAFNNRVELLRKQLSEREQLQTKIIEQRVNELLNPNLNWDGK